MRKSTKLKIFRRKRSVILSVLKRHSLRQHTTLPGILPIIAINFVLRMGSVLDAGFEQIFIMYSPYIKENADILGTYTYRLIREASLLPQYALSTAVGLFNGVVSMVLVLLTNWFAKKYLKTGLW